MPRRKNPCSYEVPCVDSSVTPARTAPGRKQVSYDALPRNIAFSYMPPAYYAKGFRILEAYRREFDFTEMRKLLFLEDPEKQKEWGALKKRLPYPENRVVDLPGTRNLHFKNYCMRSLTPESAMSWRDSIAKPLFEGVKVANAFGKKGTIEPHGVRHLEMNFSQHPEEIECPAFLPLGREIICRKYLQFANC